jgi:hypothetical protein
VKEKFTANRNEAPDLSTGLAFESHRAAQQSGKIGKIESRRR